jgi:hypothetical protein
VKSGEHDLEILWSPDGAERSNRPLPRRWLRVIQQFEQPLMSVLDAQNRGGFTCGPNNHRRHVLKALENDLACFLAALMDRDGLDAPTSEVWVRVLGGP